MSVEPADGPGDDKWAPMMRAALAGDEAAYRRLLEEIGRAVRAMARGAFSRVRVGDADIEDVVQETLLAIHLKRRTWDGGPRLAPGSTRSRATRSSTRCAGAARGGPSRSRISRRCSPRRKAEDPHLRSDIERVMLQARAAPARHRDRDLARRPVDRRDGGAAFDERSGGARRAAPRAEVSRRGLAERDAMKTADLINSLAADPPPPPVQLGRRVVLALAFGAA